MGSKNIKFAFSILILISTIDAVVTRAETANPKRLKTVAQNTLMAANLIKTVRKNEYNS